MKQETEKITVSLPKDTLCAADANWERLGFSNLSEFIDAAIREYLSRDLLKEFTGELTQFYQKIERSEIKDMEQHLAKLSYKIAVEIAQVHLMVASMLELPYADTEKLRGKAVQLVNKSRGYIPLNTALKNTVELHCGEEDDDE